MANGNIREVVLGFKQVVNGIPSQYDNYEEALDDFFQAFYLTMKEMLPMKYFALYEDKFGREIAIFDEQEDCKKWIDEIVDSCEASCYEISFFKFNELSYGEWNNPNCYYDEEDVLIFRL